MKNIILLAAGMVVIATVESYIIRYPGFPYFTPFMGPVFQPALAVPTVHQTVAVPSLTQTVAVPSLTQTVAVPTSTQAVAVPSVTQTVAVPSLPQTVAVPSTAQTVAVPSTPIATTYVVLDSNYRENIVNDIANSNSYNPLTGQAEAFQFAVSTNPSAFGPM